MAGARVARQLTRRARTVEHEPSSRQGAVEHGDTSVSERTLARRGTGYSRLSTTEWALRSGMRCG